MTRAMRTGRLTTLANNKWKLPSIEQFMEAKSGKEFKELKAKLGEETTDELDFKLIPNHVFTHAFVFYAMEGQGT
jgi:hypothetical protein